ncbi:hypothetical protein BH11PSE8_BH11PSE8_24390 [soil metagenome]
MTPNEADPLGDPSALAWVAAWAALGLKAPPGLRADLDAAWAEPHRHYHDPRHLAECLVLWSRWRASFERPGEVGLALWFHDAVYDPKAAGNEVASAAWAARALLQAGATSEVAQRVYDLVLATRHDAPALGIDAQGLVDIDLSILGSAPERFAQYDADVRREYDWVPGFRYRRARRTVLQSFLDRPRIYATSVAFELLEAQARLNLAGALERLAQ